ncbi:MAG: DUF61 family protein [Candidatus Thermoplasmatota archaeon]
MEENRFRKLITSQLKTLNTGMVSQKKSLKTLLKEEKPSVKKRDGEKHSFEKDHLKEVDEHVPIHKKDELKLPIVVYNDPALDRCYVKAKIEGTVVKKMVGLESKTVRRDKTWFSKPLIAEMIREYDDIFQFVWTPKLNRDMPSKSFEDNKKEF